jgi:hypothetical protein
MTRRSLAFILVPFLATALSAQDKAFVGSWKLNPAKSKSTGPIAWKSRTLTIAVDGDLRKFKSEGVNQEGTQLRGSYEAKSDGKDYPITGNLAGGDMIALKDTTPGSATFTIKKGGKVVGTGTSVVSADGKTLTITAKGTTADGKTYTSTGVYDKM